MYKIDCHSHFFEPAIQEGISKILQRHKIDEMVTSPVRTRRKFLTPEERLQLMDRSGVDVTTIEYQIVWQHYLETEHPPQIRVEIARFVNDRLAEVAQKYSDRYFMMADIPLLNLAAAAEEVERCHKLGAKGICLNTSAYGRPLTDPKFDPFWAQVDRFELPVFLHPLSLLAPERISGQIEYHAVVGYPFDTTIAAVDFLTTGFFDKYPRVNIMLCHCGGALPFIRKRLDPVGDENTKLSSQINKFFYDTAMCFPRQIKFTIGEVGLNRICFGTDYPYYGFSEGIEVIESLNLIDDDKEKIFNGNARRFFGIA